MKLRAVRVAAALSILPLVLSGCDLLFAGLYPTDPFGDPFADPFLEPGASAEFGIGKATLEISAGDKEQTIVLDQVSGSTMYDSTTITWRNDDGWSMSMTSFGLPGSAGLRAEVTFQSIRENELWMTDFEQSNSCSLDVAESTLDRISGSVDCRQMRWRDGVGTGAMGLYQPYIEGEPRFDVRVTFEAEPAGDAHVS